MYNIQTKKVIYGVAFVLLIALAILGLVENRAAERVYNSSSNPSSLARTQCNEKMGFTVCFPSNWIVEEDAGESDQGNKSLHLTSPEEPKSEVTVYDEANTYGTVRADEIIKKKGAEKIGEKRSKKYSYNWITWSEYASKTIEGIDIYGVVFVADNRIYEMQFSNRRKKEDLTEDENRIVDTFYFPINSHRNQELGFSIEYPTGGWVTDEENGSADKSLRLMSPAIAAALAGKGGVPEDVEEVGPDILVTNRVNIYGAIGLDKIIAKRGGKKIGDVVTTFGWKGVDYLGKNKKGSDMYCALFEESGHLYEVQFNNREKKEEVTELEKMALNSFISEQSLEEVSKKWAVADKPVIYLYPQTPQDVKVSLDFDGTFTATYPDYNDGWEVFAYPDGRLINSADGKEYSYLFWEGVSSEGANYDFNQGFVVAGKDTAGFLQDKLSQMGLTPKEYNEFIVYWMPKMQDNRYNLIHFASKEEYDDHARLTIEPKPDSILRVFMAYKPLEETREVKAQDIKPFVRGGFTVVEWGGTELE